MAAYPQSVAYTRVFYAYLTSDHVSAATGKTITMNVSKAGAAFGAAGGTITEIANGAYKIVLTTTDTNTIGDLAFYGTATGTDDIKFTDQVTDPIRGLGAPTALPGVVAGANGGLPLGDAAGRVDIGKALGTAVTLDANNVLNVSTKYIGGTLQTARDIGLSVLLSSGTGAGQVKLSAGYIAPNWGDVGNPSTVNNLSGTTVKTLTDAPADSAGTTTLLSRVTGSVMLASSYTAPPSAATISGAVWDVTLASHVTAGSTGAALNAAGAAGDPWITTLPGAYTAGSAGYIVGNYLKEVWQIHGLDSANPMTVSATQRLVASIIQNFTGTTTKTVTRA